MSTPESTAYSSIVLSSSALRASPAPAELLAAHATLLTPREILEMIRDFRFDDAELSFLSREDIVDARTIDWLANYRFTAV